MMKFKTQVAVMVAQVVPLAIWSFLSEELFINGVFWRSFILAASVSLISGFLVAFRMERRND